MAPRCIMRTIWRGRNGRCLKAGRQSLKVRSLMLCMLFFCREWRITREYSFSRAYRRICARVILILGAHWAVLQF